MGLTQEKIAKNARKYFQTGEEYGFMPESLMTFLGKEFIGAPCSPKKDMNNAFDGGLIAHLLLVTRYAVTINDSIPEPLRVDKKSLVKVCCLHQIGKAKLFKPCESQWHRDNQGKFYEFDNNITPMKVGERSAYYALSHGVELNEAEYSAIVFHDKDDDDAQAKYHNSMLGDLLKIANTLAIHEEKSIKE